MFLLETDLEFAKTAANSSFTLMVSPLFPKILNYLELITLWMKDFRPSGLRELAKNKSSAESYLCFQAIDDLENGLV